MKVSFAPGDWNGAGVRLLRGPPPGLERRPIPDHWHYYKDLFGFHGAEVVLQGAVVELELCLQSDK